MNGDLESEIGFTQSRLHVNAVVRRVLVRICDRTASNVRGLRRSHARPARVAAYAPARGQRARAPARYPGSRYRFDILWILVRYINPKRNPTRRACACAGGGTGPTPNQRPRPGPAQPGTATVGVGRWALWFRAGAGPSGLVPRRPSNPRELSHRSSRVGRTRPDEAAEA